MKKTVILFGLLVMLVSLTVIYKIAEGKKSQAVLALTTNNVSSEEEHKNAYKQPTDFAQLTIPTFVSQTFNNCGSATLSMLLSYYGKNISQEKLASDLRPFNNPQGGIDDKEVFIEELASYAKMEGFQSLVRPNGTVELLKKLTTNGYPVVVKQWLHPNEDIGHYRIVKGFDQKNQKILVDDSYLGPNQQYDYDQFLKMWQPFNYGYMVVYPEQKQAGVLQILGSDADLNQSYKNSIQRAEDELKIDPKDKYAQFNLSIANYYLGNFAESVTQFEKVQNELPGRMLWYQLEPLYSYQQVGEDQKILNLADQILNNGNLAYAELYQLKGEVYLKEGNQDLAKQMFEKALYYNKNYDKAKESIAKL